jgi:hypothetical protein
MRKVGECGLKAALANITPGAGYIRPDLHVHGFLAFLSSKLIRWQGASSHSAGTKVPQLLTLPHSRLPEKCPVGTTQVEAVVGREYLMYAFPELSDSG